MQAEMLESLTFDGGERRASRKPWSLEPERRALGTPGVWNVVRWQSPALRSVYYENPCVGVGVRWERLLVGDVVGRSGRTPSQRLESLTPCVGNASVGAAKFPSPNRKRRHTGESRAQSPRVSRLPGLSEDSSQQE